MNALCRTTVVVGLLFASIGSVVALADTTGNAGSAQFRQGAVVCVSRPAAEIGAAALKRGGTAVDAAVATAFALAVTYPAAGNIGGGGYMLIVPRDQSGAATVFDFRETAPMAATRDMFVDTSARGAHRCVGVPGTVRGLAAAHAQLGRRPWSELVMPAVQLARDGFVLNAAVAGQLNGVLADSERQTFSALHETFAHPEDRPWQAGDQLVQPELADSLLRIAQRGPDGFYVGETATLIAREMRRGGGLITETDLAAYRPVIRRPVRGTYRNHEVLAAPPSTSGGTTLVEMLNILENFDLRRHGRWSAETLHLMVESMKRGYRDRAAFLGDPAFTSIPAMLLEKPYARRWANSINPRQATPSVELAGDIRIAPEGTHTTQISVVDAERTAVSLTYTLEQPFGSRVVVRGGGFLLNDEMNDFNWLPGVTNREGRIGTPPNQIAPGKRMLSSMCPTIVRRDGRTLLVTGSPGGRTIINTVLEVVINVVDFEMDAAAAVAAPRMHNGWLPDRVRVEPALAAEHAAAIDGLRGMGQAVAVSERTQGDAHTIWIDPRSGTLVAVPDPRISGSAAGY